MDYINEMIKQLLLLSPEMLLGLAMVGLGYGLKVVPFFPNNWIPSVCIFLPAIIYPFMTNAHPAVYDMKYPVIRFVMIGLLIGVLAWIFHNKILKAYVDKYLFKEKSESVDNIPKQP